MSILPLQSRPVRDIPRALVFWKMGCFWKAFSIWQQNRVSGTLSLTKPRTHLFGHGWGLEA